uniref:Capsid scaffolding protein n=2 Tax=Mastomys natalensis cytomegalovirus 1 TaxID=2973541 RepID=A0A9Y1IL98_9BETA|nr:capsid maturation protease [Mastomys natalensis cytomegalovirus 1]WEG71166.1 capsid maturation protease [Mastomys natalensis cytomegalovirus 1]
MENEHAGEVDGVESISNTSPIYVGGFLTLYAENPSEASLRLSREAVVNALGDSGERTVPLNINHDESASVGTVKLFDTNTGLFCVGRLQSTRFLSIVEKAANKSKLVARGPVNGLDADPALEYLSAGFPALSLSSCATSTEPSATGCDNFFNHVSLCGLGRRRGTLAVYGRDFSWIADRFPVLSNEEKDRIVNACDSLTGNLSVDPFKSDPYGLLASTVDDGYIADRLCRLRYDKRVLGLQLTETYVKASEPPDDGSDRDLYSIRRVDSTGQEDPKIMAQAPHGIPPVTAVGGTGAHNQSLPSDCVYLSRDALVSILSASSRGPGSNPINLYPGSTVDVPIRQPYFDQGFGSYTMDRGLVSPGFAGGQYGYYDRDQRIMYDPRVRSRYDMNEEPYRERYRQDRGYRDRRRWRTPSPDEEDDDDVDRNIGKRYIRSRSVGDTPRKRRRGHAQEDDLSLPGERGYSKQVAQDPRTEEIGEMKAALNELRKDLSQIWAVARTEKVTREELGQAVGSSDQKYVSQVAEPPSEQTKRPEASKPEVVNASCEPNDVANKRANDMLEVNKRVFVSLLNKID